MQFTISPDIEAKRLAIRTFVDERLIPLERDRASYDAHENIQHGLLAELRHPPRRRWVCPGCRESIDGPFEQCWNCGAPMP